MHSLIAVYELSYSEVGGDARQHIRVVSGKVFLRDQEIYHLTHCQPGCLVQVLVQPHGDKSTRCFSLWPLEMHIFSHDELKGSNQGGLKCRYIDLAVPLARVSISDEQQRSGCVNWQIKRSPCNQVLVIEVPAVYPGRSAADAPGDQRRRHPNAAKKRLERYFNAVGESGNHSTVVQWDDSHPGIWKVIRKESPSRAKGVVGVGYGELDRLYSHFEHVTRLGALDINWPCQNVPARSLIFDFAVYVSQLLLYLIGRRPRPFEPLRA